MKKREILEILKRDIISTNQVEGLEDDVKGLTTNLQKCSLSDVVFYKVGSGEQALELFKKRLHGKKPALLILNHGAEHIKDRDVVFVEEQKFLNIQKTLCDLLYPNKDKMKIVGVTGTNGKTTTVNLAMQISSLAGHQAFSVGTIGVQDANGPLMEDLESTTPSYIELRMIIHNFQDKYEVCFIEVSSHSLVQKRLHDLTLDGAAWTSFSQDHLDYHKTMEEYFEAKILIEKKFLKPGKHLVVPVFEKELYQKILKNHPNAKVRLAKTLEERSLLDRPLFYHSSYNQSNVEIALQLNADLWGEKSVTGIALQKIKTPLGRFSIVELKNENLAIIDYAHTPDALTNIGSAIKKAFPGRPITVVFGCGGNRDKTKRPLMARAVQDFADKVIVTSDNPRDEAPEDIIMDVIKGLSGSYEAVVDRKKAILHALESMGKKEITLIAGKGHEEYQEVKGVKHPFSDIDIVKSFHGK